ncbi:SGNH/GDSL hydrolase family protein [Paludisphaera sp.]|uniref:alginate O-acetyltransferase AlgX-related protein n=1 Tax=Paludisphaera sp. TaxID=2017432 RepID=UPI00301D44A8
MARRRRALRLAAWAGWLALVYLGVKAGATAPDTNPEHLAGLLALGYLAAWGPFFVFSPHGAAGTLGRFALGTTAVLATFAAMEAPARLGLLDYREVFATPTPSWQRRGNAPDADLIYVREPNQRARLRYVGGDLYGLRGARPWKHYDRELATDSHGFRNPIDMDSADVAVVGDSFVEGLHVEAADLMTARLADLMGRSVANLGRNGYGPQQEIGVLKRYAMPMKPAVCVWSFFEGNDLHDLHEYDDHRKNLPRILDTRRSQSPYARSFARNSLAFVLRELIRPAPTKPADAHLGMFTDREGREVPFHFNSGIQFDVAVPKFPRGNSDEMKRVAAILAEARDVCRANGVELVVAFVPAKLRIYRDLCRFAPDSPCPDWPTDDLPDDMRRVVEGLGPDVGYVDLTPALRAAAESGEIVYLPDDPHWAEAGHRVAAEALAPELSRRFAQNIRAEPR